MLPLLDPRVPQLQKTMFCPSRRKVVNEGVLARPVFAPPARRSAACPFATSCRLPLPVSLPSTLAGGPQKQTNSDDNSNSGSSTVY